MPPLSDDPPRSSRRPICRSAADAREMAFSAHDGRWSPGIVALALSMDADVCSSIDEWVTLLDDLAERAAEAERLARGRCRPRK